MPWPAAYDNAFPGYPYANNTEYVDASYANYWVTAMQAIETGIGYGSGTARDSVYNSIVYGSSNPLYSYAFSTMYPTIRDRISGVETALGPYSFSNPVPGIDTSAADVQPVAASAAAGSVGKFADSGHVHQGVKSFNGRSGAVTTQASDYNAQFASAGGIGQIPYSTGTGAWTLSSAVPTGGSQVGNVLTVSAFGTLFWGAAPFTPGDIRITGVGSYYNLAWQLANGTAVGRTSYPVLFNNLTINVSASSISAPGNTATLGGTITFNAPTTSGANGVPLTNQPQQIISGWAVEFVKSTNTTYPTASPDAFGTVTSVTGSAGSWTSIVLSLNTSIGGQTGSFYFFPNGNGDHSSTFNLPNVTSAFGGAVIALVKVA